MLRWGMGREGDSSPFAYSSPQRGLRRQPDAIVVGDNIPNRQSYKYK
jgi:hypothetical protein